jgi:hypothetical protein
MSVAKAKKIQFAVNPKAGAVFGLLMKPNNATALLVLAHGRVSRTRSRSMRASSQA